MKKYSTKQVDKLVTRALFDPEYADFLIKAASGKIEPAQIDAQIKTKIINLDAYRDKTKAASRAASIAGLAVVDDSGE